MRLLRGRRPSFKLLLVGFTLVLVSGALGYVAATAVRSPAQVVADTAPPAATTLTEPVQVTRVHRSVAFDGTVEPRHQREIQAPSAGGDGGANIVTRITAKPGTKVTSGDLIAEIGGRPVMVLQGQLPAYRTLAPGNSGPDVAQLQRALERAGYDVSDEEGVYGSSTSEAVDALYSDHGHSPQRVGQSRVNAAEQKVRSAERKVEKLEQGSTDDLTLEYAREDLDQAYAELASARAKAGARVALGEVAFVPRLPARVASVNAGVGDQAEGTLLTVSSGRLVARGAPLAADAEQIQQGDGARLLPSAGGETPAKVTGVTDTQTSSGEGEGGEQGGSSDGAGQQTFTMMPQKKLPPRTKGSPVRVVVAVESSPEARLTVPVSAISVAADGQDTVTVLRNGQRRTVPVTTGFTGEGLVQVKPEEEDALGEGDRVVVGVGG